MNSQTEVERQASRREAEAQVVAEAVQSVEQEQEQRLWMTFAEAASVEEKGRLKSNYSDNGRSHRGPCVTECLTGTRGSGG